MKLKEIYSDKNSKPVISFEVFPPNGDFENLIHEIKILSYYNPEFISITYSANGKGGKSFELLQKIKALGINVMPHFTCITSSKESIKSALIKIEQAGVKNVLALRGDVPDFEINRSFDFYFANELVQFIKTHTNLSIGVAGYPEGHIESPDLYSDIKNLKKKVAAGADAIFTQLFFDNKKYFDYVDILRNEGINLPVIPGIMPIISKKQITKMTSLAKITVSDIIKEKIEKYKDEPQSLQNFGIDYATKQCIELIEKGVPGLHFFTLNKSYSTSKILDNIKGELWKT